MAERPGIWADIAANVKPFLRSVDKAVKGAGKFVSGLDKARAKLKAFGTSMVSAGKKMAKWGGIATVALAAIGVGVVKAAATFEDSMTDVLTMTGLTGDALEEMRDRMTKSSMEMAEKFGIAATEINKAFYQVLSSGAQAGTEEFENLANAALMMAKVVGMEPAVAVEQLSDTLHAFEMSVKDSEKMANIFFKTSMLGATTVDQVAVAMTEASKVAVQLGISLEDTAALLTGWAAKGIKGSEAGTAFRSVMAKLMVPTKIVSETLESMGVKVADSTGKLRNIFDVLTDLKGAMARLTPEQAAMNLKLIAGEEAFVKLAAILSGDLNILKQWSEELKEAGIIQKAFDIKMKTFSARWSILTVKLKNAAITLGLKLLPKLAPIIDKITEWIEANEELIEQRMDEFVEKLGEALEKLDGILDKVLWAMGLVAKNPMTAAIIALGVALGPVIFFLGIFAMGIGKAAIALAALNPAILLIIVAIGLLTWVIVKNWDTIKEKFWELAEWLEDLQDNWKEHLGVVTQAIRGWMNDTFKPWWDEMKEGFDVGMEILRDIWEVGLDLLFGEWEGTFQGMNDFWDKWAPTMKGAFKEFWGSVKSIWETGVNALQPFTDKLVTWWRDIVMPWLGGLSGAVKNFGRDVAEVGRGLGEEVGLAQGPGLGLNSSPALSPATAGNSTTNNFYTTDPNEIASLVGEAQRSVEFGRGGV